MDFLKDAAKKYTSSGQNQSEGQQTGGGDYSFLQQAAGKYMGGDDHPSAAGNGGGLQWDNLSRLTEEYDFLDKNKDGKVDAKDFMSFFGGSSSQQQAAPQAGGAAPPAGYPTSDGKAGDPNIVNQLLNKFQQEQGETFEGTDRQWAILSKLATALTGKEIPPFILKRLVQWKLKGAI